MKNLIQNNSFLMLVSILGTVLLMSLTNPTSQQNPWVAPSWADTIKNPLQGNANSITEGKKLYVQYCVVCHGDKGRGDGIAAAGLTPKPADHSSEKIQRQSDGAIFWKMSTGRSPMASYETTLNKMQRWELVNYIRTLKKPEKVHAKR